MTFEEKERELVEYTHNILFKSRKAFAERELSMIAHNLIQDFKNECDTFNSLLEDENIALKEQVESYKDAYKELKRAIGDIE